MKKCEFKDFEPSGNNCLVDGESESIVFFSDKENVHYMYIKGISYATFNQATKTLLFLLLNNDEYEIPFSWFSDNDYANVRKGFNLSDIEKFKLS